MSGPVSLADLLKVEESQFQSRPRGFRRVDARVKLALAAVAVVCNMTLLTFSVSLSLAAIAWLGILSSRVPLRQMAWFVLAPAWTTLGLIAAFSLGFGATPLGHIGFLTVYREGLMQGLGVASRVLADMSWVGLVFLTTPFGGLLSALRWYRVPEVLVDTLSFMYRYIFLLWDEFSAMKTAGRARGGYQRTWQGLLTTGTVVAQVFLRAYDRALRISQAMKARGAES